MLLFTIILLFVVIFTLILINHGLTGTVKKQSDLLNDVFKKNTEEIVRMYMLLDMLQMYSSNIMSKFIYNKIRVKDFKDLPKDDKSNLKFATETVREVHTKIWKELKNKVDTTIDVDEKSFYEIQLKKLGEVLNLLDMIDENSDIEYMKQIAMEVEKVITEEYED